MRRAIAIAAGALTCAGGGSTVAGAAPYTVLQCHDTADRPLAVTGWTGTGMRNQCAAGGAFGNVMNAGVPLGHTQTITLAPPSGTSIARAEALRTYAAPVSADSAQPQLGTTWEYRGWPHTGVSPFGGYLGDWSASGGVVAVTAPASLSIRTSCVPFSGGGGTCTGGAHWSFWRLTLTLDDPSAPSLQAPAELLDAHPSGWTTAPSGDVAVRVADSGSGAFRLLLRDAATDRVLHRALLQPASTTCRDVDPSADGVQFAALVPCPVAATDLVVPVDLTALGDGVRELELGIEDAAGNAAWHPDAYTVRVNAPGGDLPDAGADGENCTVDEAGVCTPRPPASSGPPLVAGTPRQGEALTTDVGAWNDVEHATWAYGWEACDIDGGACEPLPATTSTLSLTGDMVGARLRSVVTVTTNGGTATVRSQPTAPVQPLLAVSVERPSLAGVVQEGKPLTSTEGLWTSTAEPVLRTIAWHRCDAAGDGCAAIPGAAGATYTLGADDVGRTVRSVVTHTNHGGGQTIARSDASPIVFPAQADGGLGGSGSVHVLEPVEPPPSGAGGDAPPRRSATRLPVPPAPTGAGPVDNGPGDPDVRLSVRADGPRAVAGRLTTADGLAIAGAQVDVLARWAATGSQPSIAGAARTDRTGSFRFVLEPGPSRIVTVGYRLRLTDREYARTTEVTLAVRPQVTLRARHAGGAIVLAGTVPGAPPGTRKLVALQQRAGGGWRTFATTRMRGSAFSHRHRIGRSGRVTSLRFRALVERDPTWPFEAAASRPVSVTVERSGR